jgi:hypothetical protein
MHARARSALPMSGAATGPFKVPLAARTRCLQPVMCAADNTLDDSMVLGLAPLKRQAQSIASHMC